MIHHSDPEFWQFFDALPKRVQKLARKNFALLKSDPRHPSLHFKRIGICWSVRIGLDYRAVEDEASDGFLWLWIGTHKEYEKFIK